MKDNLKLWKSVETTDKRALKKVTYGRSFTSIDPQYQIKEATKIWGSYGSSWGFKSIELDYSLKDIGIVSFKGQFYYPEGEFPIINAVHVYTTEDKQKQKLDTDFAKKVETDALTKALSKLGFSADIFLEKFVDCKDSEVSASKDTKELENLMSKCKTIASMIQLQRQHEELKQNGSMFKDWQKKLNAIKAGK